MKVKKYTFKRKRGGQESSNSLPLPEPVTNIEIPEEKEENLPEEENLAEDLEYGLDTLANENEIKPVLSENETDDKNQSIEDIIKTTTDLLAKTKIEFPNLFDEPIISTHGGIRKSRRRKSRRRRKTIHRRKTNKRKTNRRKM